MRKAFVLLFCAVFLIGAGSAEKHFKDGTQHFRFDGEYTEVTFDAPSFWYMTNTSLEECEMYSFYPYGEGDESLFYSVSIWDGYRMSELSNEELLNSFKSHEHEISALDNGKRIAIAEYKNDDGKPRVDIMIPENTCYIVILYGADEKIPGKYEKDFKLITETIEARSK